MTNAHYVTLTTKLENEISQPHKNGDIVVQHAGLSLIKERLGNGSHKMSEHRFTDKRVHFPLVIKQNEKVETEGDSLSMQRPFQRSGSTDSNDTLQQLLIVKAVEKDKVRTELDTTNNTAKHRQSNISPISDSIATTSSCDDTLRSFLRKRSTQGLKVKYPGTNYEKGLKINRQNSNTNLIFESEMNLSHKLVQRDVHAINMLEEIQSEVQTRTIPKMIYSNENSKAGQKTTCISSVYDMDKKEASIVSNIIINGNNSIQIPEKSNSRYDINYNILKERHKYEQIIIQERDRIVKESDKNRQQELSLLGRQAKISSQLPSFGSKEKPSSIKLNSISEYRENVNHSRLCLNNNSIAKKASFSEKLDQDFQEDIEISRWSTTESDAFPDNHSISDFLLSSNNPKMQNLD